jgi:hypothetical protein
MEAEGVKSVKAKGSYELDNWGTVIWFLTKHPDQLWGPLSPSGYQGLFHYSQCKKLTIHPHLVPRLQMSATIPLPQMPSRHAQGKV